MEIIKALEKDVKTVFSIVQTTVITVYTRTYNREIADFFIKIHSEENILSDIKNHQVFLIEHQGVFVGTATLKNDFITRVYILPQFEHMGMGSAIMDFLEHKASENYSSVFVDPSLSALSFYEKRGYFQISHEVHTFPSGYELIHDTYEKRLS